MTDRRTASCCDVEISAWVDRRIASTIVECGHTGPHKAGSSKPIPRVHERREIANIVIAEVTRHSVAEEMIVLPAMEEYVPGGDGSVEHAKKDNEELHKSVGRGVGMVDRMRDKLSGRDV